MTDHKNIYEAIFAVMGEVGYVQKDGKITKGANYKFASEGAFIQALRPVMMEHGIIVFPASTNVPNFQYSNYETKSGTGMNMVLIRQGYRFVHAPSSTEIFVQTFGMGADSGDKASGKAMTNAFKYALRQTFMIETGDDPDETPSVDQERKIDNITGQLPSPNMSPEEIIAWKHYVKGFLDSGMDEEQAVQMADEKYYTFKKEQK